jgi:hypothetical protein
MLAIRITAVLATCLTPLCAQWIDYPTSGMPRTADGKPNLSAPAPRTQDGKPDFSGLWRIGVSRGYGASLTTDLAPGDIQPWAQALSRQRLEEFGRDDPETIGCLPGGPRHITAGGLRKIVQTPGLIAMVFEDLNYRQIYMDDRKLPLDPSPTWMGYSVGHWDGDTLVVESAGFNDRSWLDFAGHPHTESLRMTERLRRRDFGHIDLEVTLDDPKAYNKPWTVPAAGTLAPDTDLIETVCAENERDRQHLVGRTEAEKNLKIPPEILAEYVGVYEVPRTDVNSPGTVFTVTLTGGELMLDIQGKGKIPMIPLSETAFSPRLLGTYEFFKDDQGVVTHMLVNSTEYVLNAVRKK